MEGKLLGDRYLLQEKLGDQIGRKTFLALDKLAPDITKNSVVIKLLSLGNNFSWQHLKLFTREAETLKKINHAAIPRYLDYLEIDEPDFKGFALVQTYIEAENLEHHLKAGRTFSEAEVIQIARALLDTLIYLQSQSPAIVHRDLKPSNILLTNRSGHQVGDVYLVDFGSVQHLAAQEGGTITVVGTYGYMPPEQFGGRTTPASDLYSLGATLIYLVTGRHPTELPQANLRLQFASLANLSPAFEDWLAWLTEPSMDQRLATATQALEALDQQTIRPLTNPSIDPSNLSNSANNLSSNSLSNSPNSTILKPPHTDVICHRHPEYIEITIPWLSMGFAILGVVSFALPLSIAIIYNSGFMLAKMSQSNLGDNIFWGVIMLGGLALIVAIVFGIIFSYFGRLKLRIDRSKISLQRELWGVRKNIVPPSSREAIQEIHKFPLAHKQNKAGEQVWLNSALEIVAGSRIYALNSYHRLTVREIDWIAAEISEWLGMPIDETRSPSKKFLDKVFFWFVDDT